MAHRHWSEVESRALLDAWRRSGVRLETFAKQRGIVPQRLRGWKAKLARDSKSTAIVATPTLLPV